MSSGPILRVPWVRSSLAAYQSGACPAFPFRNARLERSQEHAVRRADKKHGASLRTVFAFKFGGDPAVARVLEVGGNLRSCAFALERTPDEMFVLIRKLYFLDQVHHTQEIVRHFRFLIYGVSATSCNVR